MAHGCSQASSFKDVPEKLRKAPTDDRVAANAVSVKIRPLLAAFPEVFGTEKGQSLRDQIAHRSRVPGGQFTLWFKPGQPVSVELTGGGERLPLSGDPAKSPGRLSAILFERLLRFEDAFMDLAALIPSVADAHEHGQRALAQSE